MLGVKPVTLHIVVFAEIFRISDHLRPAGTEMTFGSVLGNSHLYRLFCPAVRADKFVLHKTSLIPKEPIPRFLKIHWTPTAIPSLQLLLIQKLKFSSAVHVHHFSLSLSLSRRRYMNLRSHGQDCSRQALHETHPVYIAVPPPISGTGSPEATRISPGWLAIIFSNARM